MKPRPRVGGGSGLRIVVWRQPADVVARGRLITRWIAGVAGDTDR